MHTSCTYPGAATIPGAAVTPGAAAIPGAYRLNGLDESGEDDGPHVRCPCHGRTVDNATARHRHVGA